MTLHTEIENPTTPAPSHPRHPDGAQTRVLLTSVFGPYARDDAYGSRSINPMELYHNQVTRTQGAFSLRMFHRSWGLMMIQANIHAPCTVLDFPSRDRFIQELETVEYDVIGITAIYPNFYKVKEMCALIRKRQPRAVIVVGGHIANVRNLGSRVDADHIVQGEGVRWFRRFLGEDPDRPINHPLVLSGFKARAAGVAISDKPSDTAAALIPSVGCPLGCNFCSTSAMFGGKGKFINFYKSGDELFKLMSEMEEKLGTQSFFVMDENFLFHRSRALRLLELMKEHNRSWSLYVFSSANVLRTYSIEQLVRLGISWVWMGLEGRESRYQKLKGIDSLTLVRELQAHGIRVLGSTIIGLEEHTPENIHQAIEDAVEYSTDFHQFMLYTPVAGTPLYAEHAANGTLKDESEVPPPDIHGQLRFSHKHPHIKDGQETGYLLQAFDRDYEVNGPSVIRIVKTLLAGWKRYRNHPDSAIQARYRRETRDLFTEYTALVAATRMYCRDMSLYKPKIDSLHQELIKLGGWKARLYSAFGGKWLLSRIRRESRGLRSGKTYEPPTFYEVNEPQILRLRKERTSTPTPWELAKHVVCHAPIEAGK